MHFDISEINDFDQFLQLESEWNTLLSGSYCNIPHLRHEWFRIWWSHFGMPNKMVVILIRKGGRLVFAVSLIEIRSTCLGVPLITLQSMTNPHSFRYCFLLQQGEEEALKEFYHYLLVRRDSWHVMQFERVPSDILDSVAVIQNAREKNFIAETVDSYQSPYIQIKWGWDEYMSTLKSKFRSNLRNRTKRLNRLGKVDYELINDSKDIEKILRRGFEIEGKSWKGESGSAISCDPNLGSFYLEVAKVAMEQNWLRLSFLRVGGQCVSFDYSLVYNDKMYCMKIGYDPEFHQYSVGQLLCSEILRSCFESNIKEYDFMGETTRQKTDWTSASRQHSLVFIYNKSLISRIHYLYRFNIKKRIKLLLKKWLVT